MSSVGNGYNARSHFGLPGMNLIPLAEALSLPDYEESLMQAVSDGVEAGVIEDSNRFLLLSERELCY